MRSAISNQRFRVGVSLALIATAAAAQPAAESIQVTEQLSGTTVSIAPGEPYQSATLSVVGPRGFEAAGRFNGGPLFLDLAAGTIAGQTGDGVTVRGAVRALPAGHYRYEARLARPDGSRGVGSGSFIVANGVTVSRRNAGRRLAENGPSAIGSESTTVDDILRVSDEQNDKITSVQLLLGNSTDGHDFRFWNMTNHDGLFRIDRSTNFIPPGSNKLSIAEDGDVGLSTTAAAKRLTVYTTVINDGIRLINDNINPSFETTWDFAVDAFAGLTIRDVETGNGVFRLREGAPSESLVVSAAGDVGMGTSSPSAKLHVMGSGRIDGDVALGSSRTLKTAFDRVDTAELLARVADLPLASWRYKSEDESARHIGPFAEDFQRLFGLGDGETISVIDAQGVTLAAIQGLQQELAAKDAEIEALTARLTTLEGRLDRQKR